MKIFFWLNFFLPFNCKVQVKTIILSHIQKGEKCYSHHPFIFKCPISICICYLFEFKYFDYLYKIKIKNYIFQKKKKNPTTSHKNCSFLTWNFYEYFFYYSLKHSKNFVITNSFVQISNFFTYHNSYLNQ